MFMPLPLLLSRLFLKMLALTGESDRLLGSVQEWAARDKGWGGVINSI